MKKLRLLTTSLVLVILLPPLTGCATSGAVIKDCLFARPILVSKQDVLTDGTAVQIERHNEVGDTVCEWGKK